MTSACSGCILRGTNFAWEVDFRNKGLKSALQTAVLLTLVSVFAVALLGQNGPLRSTRDGVYTKDQAQRGAKLNAERCLACHHEDSVRENLVDSWTGNTVGALYEVIINTMPEARPGSLKPQEYADILAYILQISGYPEGKEELRGNKEELLEIVIERKEE